MQEFQPAEINVVVIPLMKYKKKNYEPLQAQSLRQFALLHPIGQRFAFRQT